MNAKSSKEKNIIRKTIFSIVIINEGNEIIGI